jgi:ceramide glucosyltransferase
VTAAFVFLGGLVLAVALEALAVGALRALRRRPRAEAPSAPAPLVSIIKPLCGLDARLEDNLESFFRLDYPAFEIVFSFASAEDPALTAARRVSDRHPEVPATFVVDSREPGLNAKVNRLAFGLARARGTFFLLADGDVRVGRNFLSNAVSLAADPSVGLVSHLFRAVGGSTLGARLEALYLDGILRPGTAAVAVVLRRPCVVGKAILLRRAAFQSIGGLSALRDHLAEDFLLGQLVDRAGYRVVLSPDEVETPLGARTARTAWLRHRRWAILRSRLGGLAYASEAFSSPVPFVAGAILCASGAPPIVLAALLLWACRIGLEAAALAGGRERFRPVDVLAIPLRDVAAAALFWAGLLGRRTRWRGRTLKVGAMTRLEIDSGGRRRAPAQPAAPILGR